MPMLTDHLTAGQGAGDVVRGAV
ncbi:hypothetical protein RAZWK3B_05452 [Roseobacter sp. AzwK-3b]|nr:hypothetical protein RAZWK3B_05452 [Roseobacter sp. AzwK-3b]